MTFSRKNVDIFIRNFVFLYWFICADVENDSLLDNAPTNYEVGCVIQKRENDLAMIILCYRIYMNWKTKNLGTKCLLMFLVVL